MWYGTVAQHCDWNEVSGNMVLEMIDVIHGAETLKNDDENFNLILRSSLGDNAKYKTPLSCIKEGHPVFADFDGSDSYTYQGYWYNGMPVFGASYEALYKSFTGEWTFETNTQVVTETLAFMNSSKKLLSIDNVDESFDLRKQPGATITTPIYTTSENLDDKFTSDNSVVSFTNPAEDSDTVDLTSYYKVYTRDHQGHMSDPSDFDDVTTLKMPRSAEWLSSVVGKYEDDKNNARFIGDGCWISLDGTEKIIQTSIGWYTFSLRDGADGIYGVIRYGVDDEWGFVGAGHGRYAGEISLVEFKPPNMESDFRFKLDIGGTDYSFDVPWDGYCLGDGSFGGSLYNILGIAYSAYPWYRPVN